VVLQRGVNESVDVIGGPVHVELLEQERECTLEVGRDRRANVFG